MIFFFNDFHQPCRPVFKGHGVTGIEFYGSGIIGIVHGYRIDIICIGLKQGRLYQWSVDIGPLATRTKGSGNFYIDQLLLENITVKEPGISLVNLIQLQAQQVNLISQPLKGGVISADSIQQGFVFDLAEQSSCFQLIE